MFFYTLLSRRNLGVLKLTRSSALPLRWTFHVTLGSVEHEGPATRKLQKEGICQAFTVAAFTSSSLTNLGSLCLGPLRHHCLQLAHSVENCTFFLHILLELGSSFASFSSIIPVFLASHCAFHAPASFDAAGKCLPRWRLALAQPSVGALRPFLAWHLCTSFS